MGVIKAKLQTSPGTGYKLRLALGYKLRLALGKSKSLFLLPIPKQRKALNFQGFLFLAQAILKIFEHIPVAPSDKNEYACLDLDHLSYRTRFCLRIR